MSRTIFRFFMSDYSTAKQKRPGILIRLKPQYEEWFRAICEKNKRDLNAQVEWWVDVEMSAQKKTESGLMAAEPKARYRIKKKMA